MYKNRLTYSHRLSALNIFLDRGRLIDNYMREFKEKYPKEYSNLTHKLNFKNEINFEDDLNYILKSINKKKDEKGYE